MNLKTVLTLLLAGLFGCSTLPESKKATTEFGEFSYYLSGQHKPTVIYESGLSDDMTTWQPVINKVASFSQVLAYNRAGFSGSESYVSSRNGETIIKELRALIHNLELKPPYVLVGHSLGGAYMELFAKKYPDEVAGVVLIDPNSAKFPQACRQAGMDNCEPPSSMPKWASLVYPAAVEGEIKGMALTHKQVNRAEHFPKVPLAVLSASQKVPEITNKKLNTVQLYYQLHQDLSRLSPISKFELCQSCSHYIHKDKPELVINAISWVISQSHKK